MVEDLRFMVEGLGFRVFLSELSHDAEGCVLVNMSSNLQ